MFAYLIPCFLLAQIPTNGLVAHYPFSGNANDGSGHNLNGTVQGAILTTDRFGNPNSAYFFDGINDYIEVAHNSQLNISGGISLSLWFNPYNYAASGRLIDKTTVNQSDAYLLDINGASTNRRVRMIVGGVSSPQPHSKNFIQDSVWFHIVATFDSSNIRFYVNGVLDTTIQHVGLSPNSNNPLRFGANSILSGDFFRGKMDDAAIYNRALSQQEVTQLYTGNSCSYSDTTHVTIYDTVQVVKVDTIYEHVAVTDTLLIDVNITGLPNTIRNTLKAYCNAENTTLFVNTGDLSLMNGYTLTIVNQLSQTVYSSSINQPLLNIDITGWGATGVYVLYVTNPQNQVSNTKKIILH